MHLILNNKKLFKFHKKKSLKLDFPGDYAELQGRSCSTILDVYCN